MDLLQRIKAWSNKWRPVDTQVPAAYKSYYQSRTIKDKRHICHAPFNNMYFNSLGDVANCWLTFDNPERYSEDKTIMDIWRGPRFTALRQHIQNFDLQARCKKCDYYLQNGNHTNVLAKAYDNDFPITDYPSMMEFELTNTCNLECTMCTGLLSSAIRANREHLPALKSPYGEKFVRELREFIPHLHEARFNGGEPFLIKIYYDIWQQFIELNSGCKMVIATNGTTLNKRVKETLAKGNFHINISIDSLIPERYAQIRVNGDLNKVLENFVWFRDYCLSQNRDICVMVNPMRNNWEEMPQFVKFCNEHQVHLWFNTIMYPEDQSIWNLPSEQLQHIYETLSAEQFQGFAWKNPALSIHNIGIFRNFVNVQVKNWWQDALQREAAPTETQEQPSGIQSKAAFYEQLNAYLEGIHYADKANLLEKIELAEAEFSGKISADEYYSLLGQASMEQIVGFISEKGVPEIIDATREAIKRFSGK
jgi:MoaA/NifB/PqqE/SkfB family radical SAM enzyme